MKASVTVRKVVVEDLDRLLELIVSSTGGKTELTKDTLYDAIFKLSGHDIEELQIDDPCLEFNVESIRSNVAATQALVAEDNGIIVGFMLYHYYFTPYSDFSTWTDCIHVESGYRRNEVGQELINKAVEMSHEEKMNWLFFQKNEISCPFSDLIENLDLMDYRKENDPDWGFLRMPLVCKN